MNNGTRAKPLARRFISRHPHLASRQTNTLSDQKEVEVYDNTHRRSCPRTIFIHIFSML